MFLHQLRKIFFFFFFLQYEKSVENEVFVNILNTKIALAFARQLH